MHPAGYLTQLLEGQQQILQQLEQLQRKDSTASISSFTAAHWDKMKEAAGLQLETVELPQPSQVHSRDPPPYQWDDRAEPTQSDRWVWWVWGMLLQNHR